MTKHSSLSALLAILVLVSATSLASPLTLSHQTSPTDQLIVQPPRPLTDSHDHHHHDSFPSVPILNIHPTISEALDSYPDDPVAALLALQPELEDEMGKERLLDVPIDGKGKRWLTEGDKLRLRRQGKFFIDLTDYEQILEVQNVVDDAHIPPLMHQRVVRPCFADISTKKMKAVLQKMTSFYNRYFASHHGVESARWLHDHIQEIIRDAPLETYISLEYHTNSFVQPSIIARFEPSVRNASAPLTIVGAHQDSANYLFPLLPAPGADDDCSGTVSILEAFRVLANRGFIPANGPVEFHWYAAEEAGLLGSLAIAQYKKEQGAKIGAMLEFDMTAFIARGANESLTLVKTQADPALTEWMANLAEEYSTIPVIIRELGGNAGSDYMSFTRMGYPSAFAAEGDPLAGGVFPGDFDPYIHTSKDTMDINDKTGVFSIDHMAKFTELAIAFVIEQAGWSPRHTREEDRPAHLYVKRENTKEST